MEEQGGRIVMLAAVAAIAAGMPSLIVDSAIGRAILGRGVGELPDGLHTPAGSEQPV